MDTLFTPLDDVELGQLGEFLCTRAEDDTYIEGKDEGVVCVSELDGFFTAVVSGPEMIPPSRWLPVIWGDDEPVWESKTEFEAIFSLLIRHMNGIAHLLMEQPENFEPLFMQDHADGKVFLIVDEWCEGYMRGVSLAGDLWEAGGVEMQVLLAPIKAFCRESNWPARALAAKEMKKVRDAITPNVRQIHAWWLACRGSDAARAQPIRREAPHVGRNDPCPCGSGKKYKKCCLQ